MIDVLIFWLGAIVGFSAGALVMASFAARAYERGHADARVQINAQELERRTRPDLDALWRRSA